MLLLPKGAVLKHDGRRYRILWTDPNSGAVYWIDIDDPKALPTLFGRESLVVHIAAGTAMLIEDPKIPSTALPEYESEAASGRKNNAWESIRELVDQEPAIYMRGRRAQLVATAVEDAKTTRQTIYGRLRRYWQWGLIPQALLPHFHNCGAPGKPREPGEQKRGRPRTISLGTGTNVTGPVLMVMRKYFSKYLRGERSLRLRYKEMLLNDFPDQIEVVRSPKRSRVKVLDPDGVPTLAQFTYHFNRENNLAARRLNRRGRKVFEKICRALLDSSNRETHGPGSRYQIDATILDLYVVSRVDRNRIVGRPTLYVVVDVFSRLIVGCYVGLEPPCHMGVALSLLNTLEDKVEFCARHNVEIEPSEWPVAEMCKWLLADGELKRPFAEALPTFLNVQVETAPSYRGDAKGVVESNFRTQQATFAADRPGYVQKPKEGERNGHDYRLDAVFTIDEVYALVILSILEANTRRRTDYEGNPEITVSGTPFVPRALWEWGLEHFRSDAKRIDYGVARTALLPQKHVKIVRRGIRFAHGLYYFSPEMMAEEWYLHAQEQALDTQATFYPGDISSIWVISPHDPRRSYRCELVPRCQAFAGLSLSEVNELRRRERENAAEQFWEWEEMNLSYHDQIETRAQQAIRKADADRDPSLTKRERTENIRANRDAERARLSKETADRLGLGQPDDGLPALDRRSAIDDSPEARRDEHLLKLIALDDEETTDVP